MPIKRFISLFLLALSAGLHGKVLRDTVVYDYLKSVQISPEGEPLDFPAY